MRCGDFAAAWAISDAVLAERRRTGRWQRDQPLHLRPRAGRLRVGLAWRGGDWDQRRALPPSALAPLARLPGNARVNLQYGADSARTAEALGFAEPAPPDESVLRTARRIAALDLVVSIDSMVAHLAGAMGAKVWLLLHKSCDWRWMEERSDSPWYPTMRLFRQRRAGDWSAPIDEILSALSAACRDRDRASPP